MQVILGSVTLYCIVVSLVLFCNVQFQDLIAFKRSSYTTTEYPVTKSDAAPFSLFKSDGYRLKHKKTSLSVYLSPDVETLQP